MSSKNNSSNLLRITGIGEEVLFFKIEGTFFRINELNLFLYDRWSFYDLLENRLRFKIRDLNKAAMKQFFKWKENPDFNPS